MAVSLYFNIITSCLGSSLTKQLNYSKITSSTTKNSNSNNSQITCRTQITNLRTKSTMSNKPTSTEKDISNNKCSFFAKKITSVLSKTKNDK